MRYIMLICVFGFPIIGKSQIDNLREEIDKIIRYDTDISYEQTPVSIIGIIDEDSTYYITRKKPENPIEVHPHTLFEVGSITKVFTSALIQILEKKEILHRFDAVNDCLPIEFRNPRLKDLKVGDLVNHYGGFSKLPEYFGKRQKNSQDPYAYYSKENLLYYYREYIPKKQSPSYNYSHTGYALLEIILENVTGEDYSSLLEKYLFQPCNMKNSFINFPEDRSLIQGYNRAFRKVKSRYYASFAASEGLKSTVEDLVNFIRTLMDDENDSKVQVLSESIKIEAPTNYNDKIFVGNGWYIVKQNNNFNVICHTGQTNGHASFIGFVAETKTGVVILSNSSFGTRDLGFLILKMINYNWNRKV